MEDAKELMVRVDATGTAHPVGLGSSRAMRRCQGVMDVLAAPRDVLVLRSHAAGQVEERSFWLAGEITRPGVLWDLIGMVSQGNYSGQLVVRDETAERSVFFERGAIVGAMSDATRERIGEVMYQYGVLDQEQVAEVVAAKSAGIRFGEAAVELGYLTREKLFELVGRQTEEIVYAVMLIASGEFHFCDKFAESQLSYRLNLAVPSLLMEGVRRIDEIDLFRARVPSGLHVPAHTAGATLAEGHEHEAVFDAVDGMRSVDDVGREVGLGSFDATRAIFQLLGAGVVVVNPPKAGGPLAITSIFNEAMALIFEHVEQAGAAGGLHSQLASFATASGVYDVLFEGAGPAPDGTVDAAKIATRIDILVGGDNAETMLGQWLYEYASFAMFLAEPMLRSAPSGGAPASTSGGHEVTRAVAELLVPLVPET